MNYQIISAMLAAGAFYQSVEFYVVCVVVAAAVVAAAVGPSRKGEVITRLLSSDIESDESGDPASVNIEVRADGAVMLIRTGVELIGPEGAVSGAVSIKGNDITFEERTVPGRTDQSKKVKATFVLDFLRRGERYHFRYESDATSSMAVFTLAIKPDVKISRILAR